MKRKGEIKSLKIVPVPQIDGVSCGYCALQAVYNYYRLGVDHGLLPCLAGRDIPVRLARVFNPGSRVKRSGTLAGNTINRFFKWEHGTIVGNFVNKTFG
ncbi:MAG: hypothetical protein NT118_09015 [Lentisphaerae bacterium]|nr:hypothetical protein [Lentisphaerota bacterium]